MAVPLVTKGTGLTFGKTLGTEVVIVANVEVAIASVVAVVPAIVVKLRW